MIVVSDTSPIANLVVVGHVRLLPQLFGSVIIPEVVYQELLANGSDHIVTRTVTEASWLEVRAATERSQVIALERKYHLDPGEANAIILAMELKADQLLIDERLGRKEAQRLGLRITGILGVLLAAKRQGAIENVRPILERLISDANFWISSRL